MLELLLTLVSRVTGWRFVARQFSLLARPPATDATATRLLEDLQEAESFNNPHEQKIYLHLRKVAEKRAMASRLSYASTPPSSLARGALTWCIVSLTALIAVGAVWAVSHGYEPLNGWQETLMSVTGIIAFLACAPTLTLLALAVVTSSRQAHKRHRSAIISAFLHSKGLSDPAEEMDNSPNSHSPVEPRDCACMPRITPTTFDGQRWPAKDLTDQNLLRS